MSRSSLAANPPDKAAAAAPAQHLYKNPPNSIEKVSYMRSHTIGSEMNLFNNFNFAVTCICIYICSDTDT